MNTVPDRVAIERAAERIQDHVHCTPVLTSTILDELSGSQLFFKCENFQKAGAFKSRGAVNAVFSLAEKDTARGVCTHSSGNHAAALARAAALRSMKAYIVMPENSSPVKIEAVKYYGGYITFCKPNLKSRESTLEKIKNETGSVEIHPYNDYQIIAGQATAARELINQMNTNPDFILAPVGGGGLMSGTALSTYHFSTGTLALGAEPAGADDAYRSMQAGKLIPSENPNTLADGLLTSLGSKTFPIILNHVDQILTVQEKSIINAMRLVWERMKIIIEPSSAVPVAAVFENPDLFRGKKTGIIISGGNCDFEKATLVKFNNMKKGHLYLIPSLLHPENEKEIFPGMNLAVIQKLKYFIVENVRTTRRMLRKIGFTEDFDQVTFFELNKHTEKESLPSFLKPALEGHHTGLISEAGLPCIADPGASIVALAHERDVKVVPLPGASSILLALIASGFNGQNFAFNGYLPIDKAERKRKLLELERKSNVENQTQIFMETPYRNNQLLETIMKSCQTSTHLCVAADISHPEKEFIRSAPVSEWKDKLPDLHKRPALFLLYCGQIH